MSLLTADEEMTSAVHNVFSFLTAYSEHSSYAPLMVSPVNIAENSLDLIGRESDHARLGRPARIIAKMNALLDKNIIAALYRALQKKEPLATQAVVDAANSTVPLSIARHEAIDEIREMAKGRFTPVA